MRKIKRKGDSYIRDAFIIFGITLFAGLMMALVFQITAKPIKESSEKTKMKAFQDVFPDAKTFKSDKALEKACKKSEALLKKNDLEGNLIDEVVIAKDANGEDIGYVLMVTSKNGYGGNVVISFGIDQDGIITALEVISMNETAGLGANCQTKEFKSQFKGIPAKELVVTKDGKKNDNEIDALSGATITSNAVVNAVNSGVVFVDNLKM